MAAEPRHQAAVVASAQSDGEVDALVYQLDKPIVEGDVYGDVGPFAHELIHDRQDVQPAERYRKLETQPPARRLRMAQHRHLRLVEIGEDADAAFKKYGTLPGQRDAPCRSLQQADAQPVFEAQDVHALRAIARVVRLGKRPSPAVRNLLERPPALCEPGASAGCRDLNVTLSSQ